MNIWRVLFSITVPAIILGSAVNAPNLQEKINFKTEACAHGALRSYLWAYLYKEENTAKALFFLGKAENELEFCRENTKNLSKRIIQLRAALFLSIDNSPDLHF